MTREQAINSMISHGFTVEQAGEIIKAVTPQFSSGLDKNSKKLEKGTTKNNLGVDCINKADFVKKLESETIGLQSWQKALIYQVMDDCHSVTPQEPQEQQTFKWCTDCKEYDQEKHCCHRWSKVIRDTVEEMKQEQEPILDKVRAEIEQNAYPIVYGINNHELGMTLYGILQVIDKYKGESEVEDGNDD